MKHKNVCALCLVLILVFCLSGCRKYDKSDFIGKTFSQIETRCGTFDVNHTAFVSTDSSYRGIGCGYLVKESRVGFLGTTPAEYFFVVFDKNGVAVDGYYGYISDGG